MSGPPQEDLSPTGVFAHMVLEIMMAIGANVEATGTGDVRLLVAYATIALGVSFLCSILEAVVLSISPTWVAVEQNAGTSLGKTWSKLKQDDSVAPLTAILTLNTISHTMGAAGVGSQVQLLYGDGALTLASVLLTLAMLFLSEIIPKTLGSAYWRALARPCGSLLVFVVLAMKVLIVPIQGLKRILPHGDLSQVSREEVAAIADLGEEGGVLKTDEETIIHNVLQMREIRVKEVMTPRTVMHWVDDTDTVHEVIESNPVLRYSRMPVLGEDLDDVLGLVLRSSVLTASSKDEHDATMASLMRPIIRISGEASVEDALVLFRESRQHFALVVDEFGGTQGAITLEDVLETLVGAEFVDELDEVEDLREYAREQAALSGEE